MGQEDSIMKKRQHTPEQIIRKLAEGDRLLNQGSTVDEVARHLEITASTWHRWKNQYGGMKGEDAKRLKELEKENQRLKKLVANQALDIDMLKELAEDAPIDQVGWPSPSSQPAEPGRFPERGIASGSG
jgi:putative transposase